MSSSIAAKVLTGLRRQGRQFTFQRIGLNRREDREVFDPVEIVGDPIDDPMSISSELIGGISASF